ncbi:MAG: hypothetical protein HY000_20375, partial [Planctomycetes bacterium]|nr:hypothetical protein [Planctomycetota bacterium]
MIALNQQYVETDVDRSWQDQFLDMLPSLNAYTRYAFRHLPLDSREEAIQEALALALAMLVRLYQQGRGSLAYATALARYAVAQVCSGRRAATSSNSSDVLSVAAQRKHHFHVERLDVKCPEDNQWRDA